MIHLALLAAGVAGAVLCAQEVQPPRFRTDATAVTIDVSVRRGRTHVGGLTGEDFEVLDNGILQRVTVAAGDTMPVDVTLVFDQSRSALVRLGRQFASDLTTMAGLLRPIDRLRVISFATDAREVQPMRGPDEWKLAGSPDLAPPRSIASWNRTGRHDRAGLDLFFDPKRTGLALYDALLLALARPATLGRRHLIVAFSLGTNTGAVEDGTLVEAVAARADAILHVAFWDRRVMGIRLDPSLLALYTHRSIEASVAATGGAAHETQDAVKAFKEILEDIRRSYILQYTATGVASGGWHTVTVGTPRFPQYVVRARRGYVGK